MYPLCAYAERLEAEASRNSRESLTPPISKPTYQIDINHDEDSGTEEKKSLLFSR